MQLFSVKLILLPTLLFLFPIIWTRGIVGNFGDIYQYAAPFRHFAVTSLQEGILPLWNPYIFAGTPFLASPQSALFYPLSILFYFLPLNYAFNVTALLHIFLSSIGMFLFLSSLKFCRSAAILGTLLWGFSFFPLSKLAAGHIIHLTGYSWFPWILTFALQFQTQSLKRLSFISLVLCSTMQFFSGHLQVWILTNLMLLILFFWKTVKYNRNQTIFSLKLCFLYFVCFFLLSAIQFLPSFRYLLRSTRAFIAESFSSESAYTFATSYSMEWKDLLCLFLPDYFGNPIAGNYRDPLHPSVYFETNTFYFGFLPFLFFLGGFLLSLKKKNFFLLTCILFFTLLALGKNSVLYNWMWELLAFLRVPARFFFLSFFCMVCGAALFWEQTLKKMRSAAKGLILLIIFLDLWLFGKKFVWSENHLDKIGRSATMEWLQEHLLTDSTKTSQRIFTATEIGNPNKTMFFKIPNVNGYEAILQKSLLSYFARSQGNEALLTTGVDLKKPDDPALRLFAIKYLIILSPLKSAQPLVYHNNQIKIYEEPEPMALISSDPPLPSYRIVKNNPHKWTIFLSSTERQPTRFFLSEAYYPGWKAWTEKGEEGEIVPWNDYFQTVHFSDSEAKFRKIVFLFSPLEFVAGAAISFVSLLLLLFFLFHSKLPALHSRIAHG